MTEIAGVDDLGTVGRGNAMEISKYIEKGLKSELSGNIIDLCPVGALTSKPHASSYRLWELKQTDSIDFIDGMVNSIRVDSQGFQVVRIFPRANESINEEWLSDKGRFSCDRLNNQRLLNVMIKDENEKFIDIFWSQVLTYAAQLLPSSLSSSQGLAYAAQLLRQKETSIPLATDTKYRSINKVDVRQMVDVANPYDRLMSDIRKLVPRVKKIR